VILKPLVQRKFLNLLKVVRELKEITEGTLISSTTESGQDTKSMCSSTPLPLLEKPEDRSNNK